MAASELYTIGYQGRSVPNFLSTLQSNSIQIVVDVRELPLSRRAGFSKTRLSQALAAVGIDYVSARQLGSPRPLRHQYHQTGDWTTFSREFGRFLETRRDALDDLVKISSSETTCLLCFEHDGDHCHRSIVAEAVRTRAGNDLRVKHL